MNKALLTLLASSLLVSFSAISNPATSEKQAKSAVEFRQSILKLVRSNVGALGGMAKGAIPFDAETMQRNGKRIEQLSLMMEDYFVVDTRGFDLSTDALPKLWDNKDDFNGKIVDLTNAAKNLQTAAGSGDEGQYKAAISQVFKTCKGCHDSYKAD